VNRWSRLSIAVVMVLLGAIALGLGASLYTLAVDDAYITFRYAHNLATGQGFAYNAGRPVLSTTAPLYALFLSFTILFYSNIPILANVFSAAFLLIGALLLFRLGYAEKEPWAGALAALLFVTFPLLWLSLGLETAAFLALALAAVLVYSRGRLLWTGALLALAVLTRGDGLILVSVLAADWLLRWLRAGHPISRQISGTNDSQARSGHSFRDGLGALGIFVAVLLPAGIWLALRFGSPLPATLRAKVAQAELGVTGFYAYTTYLQGLAILARARLAQSPLYLLFLPALVAGLVAMLRRGRWVRLLLAWALAHLAGYTLLGVTPYVWYYAPLVPGLVATSALGIVEAGRALLRFKPSRQDQGRAAVYALAGVWALLLLITLLGSDRAMERALDGPVPPPEDPVSKVLPEAKVGVYRQAGEWLRDNTPADTVVGVTEVGIMGYFAERTMVDFLGLLEPDVAEALARGDLYWALLRYQPDYLALTAVSPLYAYDLRADPWFQAAYEPVQTFSDTRFWGSPLTVYHRRVPRSPLLDPGQAGSAEGALPLDAGFEGGMRLVSATIGDSAVQPGDVLPLTLHWEATGPVAQDYTVFVHLLGAHDRVIAQRDASPGLGARPTSQWLADEIITDPYLIALPAEAYAPDQAMWEVGLYDANTGHRLRIADGSDNVRFGAISIAPSPSPLRLDFGPVALTGYELDRLALAAEDTLHVALQWEASAGNTQPVEVTIQLTGEAGHTGATASERLESARGESTYHLAIEPGSPPGAYDLVVQVTDASSGQILPLLGADGQPRGERAVLTKVRLYAE
jgi:hypothetical protein